MSFFLFVNGEKIFKALFLAKKLNDNLKRNKISEQSTYKGDEPIWSKDEQDEQTQDSPNSKPDILTDLTSLTSRINYFTFITEIKDGVN